MINISQGDSFAFKVPLIDGETKVAIDPANIAKAFFWIDGIEMTLADPGLSIEDHFVQVALTEDQTEQMEGVQEAWLKVQTSSGVYSTILEGDWINFLPTPQKSKR